MVEKKPTSENWPVITGDYIVGDPESPVAVATLASHIEEIPSAAGAAIAGAAAAVTREKLRRLKKAFFNPSTLIIIQRKPPKIFFL